MLTVHHLGQSQSERIVWLCEELGLDYAFKRYERRADNRLAPDEYKSLHPMGIAPVVTDDDGFVLGESGAICDYLCARYGQGRLVPGVDDPDFAGHLFWFHWSNGTFMTTLMMQLALRGAGRDVPMLPFVADRSRRAWEMIETRLGETPYFGGSSLTTADIMMVYGLTTSRASGAPLDDMPNLQSYLAGIRSRPAYQRAMAKAEPGAAPA